MRVMLGFDKIRKYNLTMLLNNAFSYIYTKLFWKKARLVRFPIRVYGKKSMNYGHNLVIGNYSKIDIATTDGNKSKKLIIGNDCIFGDMLHIAANYHVVIGDNLLAASRVFITDSNHGNYSGKNHSLPSEKPYNRQLGYTESIIGDNVWIGENVCVLAGSIIGNGCVVASNAVVNGVFPENCIIGGIPAKIIKKWDPLSMEWKKINNI